MTKNLFALLIVSAALCSKLQAQQEMPRTEHGHPDLQGTYTFRTLTPLQRPTELADKATLTREEAAEWAAYENRRQNRDCLLYTSPSPRD